MKNTLQAGVTGSATFDVDRERTIDFMGEKARVYATPMLVRDIEIACRDLLGKHLDPGEDSVGTRVELDHLAATLMGMRVDLTLSIAEVKGRAVTFDIAGRDSVEPICRGRHARFIVDVKKTEERLAAKAHKAGLS
jgi:fluoroacetyl-CoA thioesterase